MHLIIIIIIIIILINNVITVVRSVHFLPAHMLEDAHAITRRQLCCTSLSTMFCMAGCISRQTCNKNRFPYISYHNHFVPRRFVPGFSKLDSNPNSNPQLSSQVKSSLIINFAAKWWPTLTIMPTGNPNTNTNRNLNLNSRYQTLTLLRNAGYVAKKNLRYRKRCVSSSMLCTGD